MINLVIEQRSVDQVDAYLERVKLRIFEKMREGMTEAMQGLAGETVYQMTAAGIRARTGQLFTDVLASPKVRETPELITGRVSAKSDMEIGGRKFKGYLGTALDEGFRVPASKQPAKAYQFTAADQESLFTRGHAAFDVKPHPFWRRAEESFKQPIFEIIERRVAEARE